VSGGLLFSAVAAGDYHTCGITKAGTGYCWGIGGQGQLGTGTLSAPPSSVPLPVSGGQTFKALAAGANHTCAVATSGAMYCWGTNAAGEAGNLYVLGYGSPNAVLGGRLFTSVTAGANHTCGVTTTRALYCWGKSTEGELGNGGVTNQFAPVAVSGGVTFGAVAAGSSHTCGLTPSGTAYCWGSNRLGQLGKALERGLTPAIVNGLTGAAQLAIGATSTHTCVLAGTGAALCWGNNTQSQLGNGTAITSAAPESV